jgi:protein SCO1/2
MGNRDVSRAVSLAALLILAGAMAAGTPRHAFPQTAGKGSGEGEVESRPVQVKLEDLPLLDQDGKTVRFRADAVGGRIAVIDTIFTTCGLICPILGAIFADLQEQLGDRLGKDVALVSITVDPQTDIPPRLKKYSEQWEARPGWTFLTGGKPNVDKVLAGLGMYAPDFTDHPTAILVGDGKSGEWTRFYGFATPEQLMERVRELTEKRKSGGKP